MKRDPLILLMLALWVVVTAIGLALRPALPVDETRYLSVAWEMRLSGDWLVPHINGLPYSHKPPLLFWLINLGWLVLGPVEWWARLVAPLFGLGTLFLTARLARILWPAKSETAVLAPVILATGLAWGLFASLTMFDTLVAACALIGLVGIALAWRDGGRAGWIWLTVGIGLGVLSKGPVILLHTLPVAVFAPFWDRERRIVARDGNWKRWYRNILLAVLGGAAIGLAWAVPAAIWGGEEFRRAILWGQTAGRMVESFAHKRPWYWFLALIVPLLLPWSVWPALWRNAIGQRRAAWADGGIRFCLIWFGFAFVAFSLISGKQMHYLLPLFPAFGLALGWLLAGGEVRRRDNLLPGLVFAVAGVAAYAALAKGHGKLPLWIVEVAEIWALPAALAGLAVAGLPTGDARRGVAGLALLSGAAMIATHFAVAPGLALAYDLRPVAAKLAAWEAEGYVLAHYGRYHGQMSYLGRIKNPVTVLDQNTDAAWLAAHPKSKVVSYDNRPPRPDEPQPDHAQPYRGSYLEVWDGATLAANPTLGRR